LKFAFTVCLLKLKCLIGDLELLLDLLLGENCYINGNLYWENSYF